MKVLLALIAAVTFALPPSTVWAKGGSGGRPHYGGGSHTTSHGGHYAGGKGSSHKGGAYKNTSSRNQYGKHK
ncbi:hypothetical protein [Oryzomicrobium terrae]|uniref:hypothetical protein n=1 Tax=Oryzomicrobium terrae TaxID=1735038 RepID=UPI0011EE269B|nr:hypothetical protein [Oryzomicrobium terrae]